MSQEFSHEEENLGKVYDHRLMKRLLEYVRPYSKWVALGFFFSVEVAILQVLPLLLVKKVIDGPVATGDAAGIMLYSGLYLLTLLFTFVVLYANTYLLTWIGQNVVRDLRMALMRHITRQRLGFFDRTPVGRLMTRMTSDVNALEEIVSSGLVTVVQDTLVLVVLTVAAFVIDWRLALLVCSTLPFLVLTVTYFSRHLRNAFRTTRLAQSRINSYLQESITGMRVIHAFRAEERSADRHGELAEKLRQANHETIFWFALFWPAVDLVSAAAVGLLAWYAGWGPAHETGTLAFFILQIDRFFWPIRDLAEKYNLFQSAMASSERVFRLMDAHDEIDDAADRAEAAAARGEAVAELRKPTFNESIRFEDVWFAYHGEDWVLRGIDLEIRRGDHVALVGPTGSGKTTITNILTRFYDIQRGRILVDGVDIREFAVADLRALFALVLQDVFLFTGDIASNIGLAQSIDDERLREICRQVNADRFIDRYPDGLKHEVRERGGTFSAGERQLIAFARALAFDPQVLILDEATSNIDTETELLIQDALVNLMEGRTAFVIAHRLSTIQHADQIVVLSHGKIAERGTHRELLAADGIYRRLYELQVREEEERRAEKSAFGATSSSGGPGTGSGESAAVGAAT